jgi:hypothetical protein
VTLHVGRCSQNLVSESATPVVARTRSRQARKITALFHHTGKAVTRNHAQLKTSLAAPVELTEAQLKEVAGGTLPGAPPWWQVGGDPMPKGPFHKQ